MSVPTVSLLPVSLLLSRSSTFCQFSKGKWADWILSSSLFCFLGGSLLSSSPNSREHKQQACFAGSSLALLGNAVLFIRRGFSQENNYCEFLVLMSNMLFHALHCYIYLTGALLSLQALQVVIGLAFLSRAVSPLFFSPKIQVNLSPCPKQRKSPHAFVLVAIQAVVDGYGVSRSLGLPGSERMDGFTEASESDKTVIIFDNAAKTLSKSSDLSIHDLFTFEICEALASLTVSTALILMSVGLYPREACVQFGFKVVQSLDSFLQLALSTRKFLARDDKKTYLAQTSTLLNACKYGLQSCGSVFLFLYGAQITWKKPLLQALSCSKQLCELLGLAVLSYQE